MRAPKSSSSSRFPCGAAPGGPGWPARTRVTARPSRAPAAAVSRAWLDWAAPVVTRQSAPSRSAAARVRSSLRTLLPPPPRPVRSSRLSHSRPPRRPTAAPSRGAGSSGDGKVPSAMRSVLWAVIVAPSRRERRGSAAYVLLRQTIVPIECSIGWTGYTRGDIICIGVDISEVVVARTVIDLDDELLASVAKELGTTTKKDTVNAALREVLANRRRAVALTRLRDAATDGAFDLALLQDKQRYRR